MSDEKKIIFSGIQPSGNLTIGNYLGALKNWVALQDQYDCYYCIVDLHAITVRQEPKSLREKTLEVLALYLAAGLDPKKNTLFIQSHVSAHSEAAWILNCFTYMGELGRMTQFKDKSAKHEDNVNSGLFVYPVLMAGDILLYQTDLVPVGADQKQHLELARDIAQRFNNIYSPTFKVPEPFIGTEGARIMSLQEPSKKMSKSDDNENAYITMLDSPDVIKRKVQRSVTDNLGVVKNSDAQPGIKNLISIYSTVSGMSAAEIENRYTGEGYARFKLDVADALIGELEPLQVRFKDYMLNKDYLHEVYINGAERAGRTAYKTLRKMQKKIGFIPI